MINYFYFYAALFKNLHYRQSTNMNVVYATTNLAQEIIVCEKKKKTLNPQTTVNPLLSIQSVSRNSQQFRESSRLAQMRQGYKTTVQSGASGVKHFPQAPVCRSLLVITTWFSGRMDQTGRISSRLR